MQPIIMPLSNPTSRAEATAPDVLRWSEGRALVATGSPFPPVTQGGVTYTIAQSNNSYIFPGVGLGVRAVMARRVSDAMMMAAAHALAASVDAKTPGDSLLPALSDIRSVSRRIAVAVGTAAVADGPRGGEVRRRDRGGRRRHDVASGVPRVRPLRSRRSAESVRSAHPRPSNEPESGCEA